MIVATNEKGFAIRSFSPTGEIIIAWFHIKSGLYYKVHILPESQNVTMITFESEAALVQNIPFRESWLLEGVSNKEIEAEIKKQL
jgi:hypothetical protein